MSIIVPAACDNRGLSGQVAERDLEQGLMDRLQRTLLERGQGFAFVGRQVHLEVDGVLRKPHHTPIAPKM